MKTLIMVPFAYDTNMQSGVNIHFNSDKQELYLKNICVALTSAKHHNPASDVALITNTDIPAVYSDILRNNAIMLIHIPFDMFLFDSNYKWGLAFYKLCALYHVVREYEYDRYCYLDSDVYIQNTFSYIWEECEQKILLYDINHGLQVADYRRLISEVRSFGIEELITHYGGEFFASNHENAVQFSQKCLEIYQLMIKRGFSTSMGDEFILSLAAYEFGRIKNAGAYIYRYWTGAFRLTSTNYTANEVSILHVPSEKENGMITLFDRYVKKGRKIENRTVHKILQLRSQHPVTKIKLFLARIMR